MREITTEVEKFIVCHNNADVIHYVNLKPGNTLSTSQEFVEEFTDLEAAKNRVNELANDENYFNDNF